MGLPTSSLIMHYLEPATSAYLPDLLPRGDVYRVEFAGGELACGALAAGFFDSATPAGTW